MSSYQELLDEYIVHMAQLSLYGNQMSKEIEDLLETFYFEVLQDLPENGLRTKKNLQAVLNMVKEKDRVLKEKTSEIVNDNLSKIFDKSSAWITALAVAAGYKHFKVPASVLNKIPMVNLNRQTTVGDYSEYLSKKANNTVTSALKSSYVFSASKDVVEQEIKKASETIKNTVEADVSTIVNTVPRTTELLAYNNNSVKKVIWIATLEGNTCLVCADLHGKIFDMDKVPDIPVHNRCRCLIAPYNNDIEVPSFKEWLNRQKEDKQKEILGKSRYTLWKDGKVSLEKFVNDGRIIPLSEL